MDTSGSPSLRERIRALVEHRTFQRTIISLILLNGVTLGLGTTETFDTQHAPWLALFDKLVVGVFVVEVLLRVAARGRAFFRHPWNLFDLAVIAISVMPHGGVLSILRILRVLRLLRLVAVVPGLRVVVEGLLAALPGMGAVSLLLVLVVYMGSVIATTLYGTSNPDQFGSLGISVFSLLQTATLDGWHDTALATMQHHPYAWIFFGCFILVTSYMVLNLFVGVMVFSMEGRIEAEKERTRTEPAPPPAATVVDVQEVLAAVESLRAEVRELKAQAGRGDEARHSAG